MDNTRQDFENRKAEIENYFKFLMIFDKDDTKLQYNKDGNILLEKIEPRFQTTLIANAFIILYNLIESTIRNSIIEIYTKVENDGLTFGKLSDKLKKIWIKQTTNKLNGKNHNQETLRDYVLNLANDIIEKEVIRFSDKMEFSGNLDAAKIREIAYNIGFENAPNGRNLVKIKSKRNRLAHGEQTFYDVGKDFSVGELNEIKNETFIYLSEIIDNINDFINTEKYAK